MGYLGKCLRVTHEKHSKCEQLQVRRESSNSCFQWGRDARSWGYDLALVLIAARSETSPPTFLNLENG